MACIVLCRNTILLQLLNHYQMSHPNYQKISVLDMLSGFDGSTPNSDCQLKCNQHTFLNNIFDCIGIRIYTSVIVLTYIFFHCISPMATNEFYFFAPLNFSNKAIITVVTRQVWDLPFGPRLVLLQLWWLLYYQNSKVRKSRIRLYLKRLFVYFFSILTDRFKVVALEAWNFFNVYIQSNLPMWSPLLSIL